MAEFRLMRSGGEEVRATIPATRSLPSDVTKQTGSAHPQTQPFKSVRYNTGLLLSVQAPGASSLSSRVPAGILHGSRNPNRYNAPGIFETLAPGGFCQSV